MLRTTLPNEVLRLVDEPTLYVAVEFEVHDMWVGAFWRHEKGLHHLWICIIPMLPLHVCWRDRWYRYYREGLHE